MMAAYRHKARIAKLKDRIEPAEHAPMFVDRLPDGRWQDPATGRSWTRDEWKAAFGNVLPLMWDG